MDNHRRLGAGNMILSRVSSSMPAIEPQRCASSPPAAFKRCMHIPLDLRRDWSEWTGKS
jgi:hypothetical protein